VTSPDDTDGIVVELTETGPNTGVFKGVFKPVTSPSNVSVSPRELQVLAYGTNMTVTYIDSARANNTPGNIIYNIVHQEVPAIVEILASTSNNSPEYAGSENHDSITITFNIATNRAAIAPNEIATKLLLREGSWGTASGLSATWLDDYSLEIGLAADSNIKRGATIT